MKPITKEYIRKVSMLIGITVFAWMLNDDSFKNYSYILLLLVLLIYLFGPKAQIPKGAAYYKNIAVLDIFGFIYWIGVMMLFFTIVLDEYDSIIGVIFFLIFLTSLPLYLVWYSISLSSKWYLFTEDTFQWSDAQGIQSVLLDDIASAEPYVKKKYPFSPAEMGMKITTESGNKIRLMSNNLVADDVFMKYLRELHLAYDDTFSEYFKDGILPEGDETFNQYLQELQKKMEKTG